MNPLYYHDVYLVYIFVLTIFECRRIWYEKQLKNENIILVSCFIILLSIFIGFRPVHPVFGDTIAYARYYASYQAFPFIFLFEKNAFLFSIILRLFASLKLGLSLFFLFVALIYFLAPFVALIKLFPKRAYIAYLIFLGAFSTYTYSVNGMRAGTAASIFLCAIAYRENYRICVPLLLMSWGFHHSMHVCIIAFLCVYCFNNSKTYLCIWLIALLAAIFHITIFQEFFGTLTDDKGAGYLITNIGEARAIGRTRYDFILYSACPIIFGYYWRIKYDLKNQGYDFMYNLYTLLNAVWLLCIHAAFTNRIAYLSWQLYPIVIAYPFLLNDTKMKIPMLPQKRTLVNIAIFHLAFTLMMHYIYYGYIH